MPHFQRLVHVFVLAHHFLTDLGDEVERRLQQAGVLAEFGQFMDILFAFVDFEVGGRVRMARVLL